MGKLRWLDLIQINLFWLGINIRNNAVQAIFLPYLVSLFVEESLRNSALGVARAAGLIVAMLAQPVFGILSDRNTSQFGRRRPYIFTGVLLDLAFLALLTQITEYWMVVVVILFIQISSNISHGPMQAIIPDLVPEDQRGLASAIKSIFELLPLIFLGFTIAALVGVGKFTLAVWVTSAALLILMVLTVWLVKEKPITEKSTQALFPILIRVSGMLGGVAIGAMAGLLIAGLVAGLLGLAALPFFGINPAMTILVGAGGTIAMIVAIIVGVWAGTYFTIGKEVFSQPSFTWWVINRLMFLAAITSIQSFALYFIIYSFQIEIEGAITLYGKLITVVGIFTLLSAIPSGWLSDRIGQKQLISGAGILAVITTVFLLSTIWFPKEALLYLVGVGYGLAGGFFVTTNWALGTRLVPDEQAGRYLGIANLAGAGAGIIGAGLGGLMVDYLNKNQPGLGYLIIFACFGLLFLLSSISLRGIQLRT
jgi:MFS family permease